MTSSTAPTSGGHDRTTVFPCYMARIASQTTRRDSPGFQNMALTATSEVPLDPAPTRYPPRSAVVGWMLFDWAAQPYFSLITTFVFAPYFATRVASAAAAGQSMWGFATAAAGLVIALASPLLGAIADASGRRKPWIAAFGAVFVI